MASERQLMSEASEHVGTCETEFRDHATGIQAPDMIQREMTADEDDIKQEKINVSNKPEVSLNELKFKELQVDEKTMEEEKSSSNGEENTEDKSNNKENSAVKNEERCAVEVLMPGSTSDHSSLETKTDFNEDDDLRKAANDMDKKAIEKEKGSTQGGQNDTKSSKGNHYNEAVVVVNDGNNNIEHGMKKDRRARFSSEITIQPKAYFKLSAETVVMMSPNSTADDVFNQDSIASADSASNSGQTVVPKTRATDSVLPRTFYPLTMFTCLFCPMIGIFAVYKSYSVKQFIKKGEIRKANEASQHARQLGVLSLCIGFFFVLAIVAIVVLISTLA